MATSEGVRGREDGLVLVMRVHRAKALSLAEHRLTWRQPSWFVVSEPYCTCLMVNRVISLGDEQEAADDLEIDLNY